MATYDPTSNAANFNYSPRASVPSDAPSWTNYIPQVSAGMTGLGALFQLWQLASRMKQMNDLQKFYKNWQQAGNYKLSELVGNAASKGQSGSPNALAGLVASAYAPFQAEAGKGIYSTIPSLPTQSGNPFESFVKAMETLRSAYPAKGSDTGINFNDTSTRVITPRLNAGDFNMNPSGNPMFNIPSEELG